MWSVCVQAQHVSLHSNSKTQQQGELRLSLGMKKLLVMGPKPVKHQLIKTLIPLLLLGCFPSFHPPPYPPFLTYSPFPRPLPSRLRHLLSSPPPPLSLRLTCRIGRRDIIPPLTAGLIPSAATRVSQTSQHDESRSAAKAERT